mmetsp:Transcript_1337/g.3851  ORF Transcript_1337/g.3851 Transcript_1337/m.3851 type:complete len:224 (-) Transcript_1337:331-1002(-)
MDLLLLLLLLRFGTCWNDTTGFISIGIGPDDHGTSSPTGVGHEGYLANGMNDDSPNPHQQIPPGAKRGVFTVVQLHESLNEAQLRHGRYRSRIQLKCRPTRRLGQGELGLFLPLLIGFPFVPGTGTGIHRRPQKGRPPIGATLLPAVFPLDGVGCLLRWGQSGIAASIVCLGQAHATGQEIDANSITSVSHHRLHGCFNLHLINNVRIIIIIVVIVVAAILLG